MANLTASNAAGFGAGGSAPPAALYSGVTRASSPALLLIGRMVVPKGYPSARTTRRGAAPSAAARTENASPLTPTAVATPTSVDITPASYGVTLGVSTEAMNRAMEDSGPVDLTVIVEDDGALACEQYLLTDSSVGLASVLVPALSATYGSASVRLTYALIKSAFDTQQAALGGPVPSVLMTNMVGLAQLRDDLMSYASTNVQLDKGVEGMFGAFFAGDDSFQGTLFGGLLAIYVEKATSNIYSSGGAYYSYLFVPDRRALASGMADVADARWARGSSGIHPTFTLGYREDPAAGPALASPNNVTMLDTAGGPVAAVIRASLGTNSYEVDFYAAGAVSASYGASGAQILHSTTP